MDVENKFHSIEEEEVKKDEIDDNIQIFEEQQENFSEQNLEDYEFVGYPESEKKKFSFLYNDKIRDEEDILRMESPFYKVDSRSTVAIRRTKTTVHDSFQSRPSKASKQEKSGIEKNTKIEAHKSVLSKNRSEAKYKEMNSMIDFKMVNKVEIITFTSLFMTVLQIINCIIRYTIIQIPLCFKVLGLVYAPLTICIIGLMAVFSVYMLIKVKESTGEK